MGERRESPPERKMNMTTEIIEANEVRTRVQQRYGEIARDGGGCGCAPSCCGGEGNAESLSQRIGYTAEELSTVPEGSNLGLGCGTPLSVAGVKVGETVLDLGSGAGFDAFLAARAVGPSGKVIGVDMTAEMIEKARRNKPAAGFENVEFRLGEIEHLPVADNSVDVIISNCVINLSAEKEKVFKETWRVLKRQGRLAISDIVALREIPSEARKDWELYTGCVAGASTVEAIQEMLAKAGFTAIRVTPKERSREVLAEWFPGKGIEAYVASATIEAVKA